MNDTNQHKKIEKIPFLLFKKITHVNGKASIYHHRISLTKDRLDEYNQSIALYNESLEIDQQITPLNEHNVTNSYKNISVAYDNFNDYSRPFYYHKKALEIYQQEQCLDLSICNRAVIYNNTSEQS